MKLGTGRQAIVGAAAAAMGLLLVLAAPAFACSAQSVVTATAATTATESTVRVSGAGYRSNVPVEVRWGGATGEILATAQVDRTGRFAERVALPADAAPGAYLVTATQALDDGSVRKATFALELDASVPAGVKAPSQPSPARLVIDDQRSFGSPASGSTSVSPWALAPAAVLGGFALVAGATVLTRESRQKVKAVAR